MTRNEFIQRAAIAIASQSVSPDPKRAWQDAAALADASPLPWEATAKASKSSGDKPAKIRASVAPPTVFPNYGRAKGQPILNASSGDLDYYANGARRSLSDESKSWAHDREQALLDAIEAERARQGGQAGDPRGPEHERRPGPNDPGPDPDDIPF